MSLDKSKPIKLPSGEIVKFIRDWWVSKGGAVTESQLIFILGDTIEQIEPDWREQFADRDGWYEAMAYLRRDSCDKWFSVDSSGELVHYGHLIAKFATPALAVAAVNELLSKAEALK